MNLKTFSIFLLAFVGTLTSCKQESPARTEGRIKRESLAVTTKIPGRIDQLLVQEGDRVKKGDTLAILDIPEVDAKMAQAKGAVKSASAQYTMAQNGATANQLAQLRAKHRALKEQYEFAEKSFQRMTAMFQDSLISPQSYDEAFAKYQGASSQFEAVKAELNEAETGVRMENKLMALGQQERAAGALQEAEVAYNERFILAPADMLIETIALHPGELATPGYAIFQGYLPETTWFRVTLAESKIGAYTPGQEIQVHIPYLNKDIPAHIGVIKQLAKYANVTTAYPEYQMEEALYEVKILPDDLPAAEELLNNATIVINQ